MSAAELIADFRPQMIKFARLQLHDDAAGEDVVQEAIEAALAHYLASEGLCIPG